MEYKHRHTKIIFTIGPATEGEEILKALIQNKTDICRLNMAHATHEWTKTTIQRIRKICDQVDRHIAVMMDIKGPEIRTGEIEGTWELEKDEVFDLYTTAHKYERDPDTYEHRGVSVNYPDLAEDVPVGNIILLDNGLIQMKVTEKLGDRLRCKVVIPGPLKSKRHINLPGVKVRLPALTEKDKRDLEVGLEENIDFVALSFVREAQDVKELREYLKSKDSKARIIAKIEDQSAIANLEEIVRESDAVMVARGDLGIECPFEQLPIIQRRAIKECINHGKPAIVATHMLESMISAPVPTRAEVSDISNAIFDEVDCIMLSGETTVGKYPLECVEVMKRISYEIEEALPICYNQEFELRLPKNKLLKSAVVLAQELENTGILIFTRSGLSAQLVSSLRPTRCPIYAFTDQIHTARQMRILWGIEPHLIEFSKERNITIDRALNLLQEKKAMKKGDYAIVLTNVSVDSKPVETIQLRHI